VIESYARVHRIGMIILGAFTFRSWKSTDSLLTALEVLRQLYASAERKLPRGVPIAFLPPAWRQLIGPGPVVDRRSWEVAVLMTLRDRLAARWMVERLLIQNISNYFELAEGFSVVKVNAPPSIVGKTIEELDLRRRFRINLVAMKRKIADSTGRAVEKFNFVPPPTEVVREGDVRGASGPPTERCHQALCADQGKPRSRFHPDLQSALPN
jgi:hypothetical protein